MKFLLVIAFVAFLVYADMLSTSSVRQLGFSSNTLRVSVGFVVDMALCYTFIWLMS